MQTMEPTASLDDAVISHYQLVAPIMEQLFGQIPIVWTAFPNGPNGPAYWHTELYGHYTKLTAEHVVHLASIGAREFHSWSPIPEDPSRCRFIRLLIEQYPDIEPTRIKEAALAVRSLLAEEGREAVPVLDGRGNIALFVPVSDAPTYNDVLQWCHSLANRAVAQHPNLISTAPNTHADSRVHLHVSSNAERRCSVLPYSYRENSGCISIPIHWTELDAVDTRGIPLASFPAHLKNHVEIFAAELATMPPATPLRQCHAEVSKHADGIEAYSKDTTGKRVWNNAKGALLSAVVNILSDGKPRTADEIIAAGQAAKTIDPKTDAHALYIDLTQNIAREKGRGHKPLIVEDPDRRFRINEPLDAWPAVPASPTPAPSAKTQAVIARLHSTSHGDDPTAFEVAVCDAFAALGFLANHMGGVGNPDGYIDAPLGVLGYRSMLECKSGVDIQKDQMVFEAAKFREAYGAQYCAIIGPQFGQRYDIVSELQVHGVSAWSIDALAMALTIGATPLELRALFEPGFAEDKVNDILWARNHGEPKRVRMVAGIIRSVGWASQRAAAESNSPTTAPLLTEDAAMMLVDQALAAQGAHVNCTHEQVRAAFEWLTNPLVGRATWAADATGIVVTSNIQGGRI